jgi:hypothetical protein
LQNILLYFSLALPSFPKISKKSINIPPPGFTIVVRQSRLLYGLFAAKMPLFMALRIGSLMKNWSSAMPSPATLRVSNIWGGPRGEPALVNSEKHSCSSWPPLRAVGGLKTSSSRVQKIRRKKKETEPPQCIIIQAIGPPPSEEEYYKAVDAENTN